MSKRRDAVYSGIYDPFMKKPNRDRTVTMERMYQRVLTELSLNRFKWVGLPDTVDERFLEMTLFHQALSIFYFDTDYDRYMAVRGMANSPNVYDNPTRFHTIGVGSYRGKTLSAKAAIPIWSNYLRHPDHDIVYLYATKLAQIDRTIEILSLAARHSHVIIADETERLSWQNIMRAHAEGEPVIFGTSGLNMENAQAFDIGVDKDILINVQIAKSKIWNECMTLLGIKNNANQDKKERMVVDEVNANDDQVVASRGVALNARSMACEQINMMYPDLAVSVGWNDNADAFASEQTQVLKII